jgi:hypothetical protein
MGNELSILLERFVSAMNKNPTMRKYPALHRPI